MADITPPTAPERSRRAVDVWNVWHFLALVLLGTLVQVLAFRFTVIMAPPEGMIGGIGTLLAYLYVVQWIGYALTFVVAWRVKRSAWLAASVCGASFALLLVVYDVYANHNQRSSRLAAERARREDVLIVENQATADTLAARRARVRTSVACGPLATALECPTAYRDTLMAAYRDERRYERLLLRFTFAVRDTGTYRLSFAYRSLLANAPRQGQPQQRTVDAEFSHPGLYHVAWPITAGYAYGYFVAQGSSHVTLHITRRMSLRQLVPEFVNPHSPAADWRQEVAVLDSAFDVAQVAVAASDVFPPVLNCAAERDPVIVP